MVVAQTAFSTPKELRACCWPDKTQQNVLEVPKQSPEGRGRVSRTLTCTPAPFCWSGRDPHAARSPPANQPLDPAPTCHGSPTSPTPCILLSHPHQTPGVRGRCRGRTVAPCRCLWHWSKNSSKAGAPWRLPEQTSEGRSGHSLTRPPPRTQHPGQSTELLPWPPGGPAYKQSPPGGTEGREWGPTLPWQPLKCGRLSPGTPVTATP